MDEEITIPMSQYLELIEDQKQLNALLAGGVDNWSGYDFSMEEFYKEND